MTTAIACPGYEPPTGPTLEEIKTKWPATVDVRHAAAALGYSHGWAYELIKAGLFPARVIKTGDWGKRGRVRVITSSLVQLLEAQEGA